MLCELKGLVLRETATYQNAKYINVLTEEKGKISVLVRGATKLRTRFTASTQIFCYSEFVLYEHNGKYTLDESNLIENYFYLCDDFDTLTVGTYVLNTAEFVSNTEQPDNGILRLALNTLWTLAKKKEKDRRLVKAAYEMRLAMLAGFAPNVVYCKGCGKSVDGGTFFLNVMDGSIMCLECAQKHRDGNTVENGVVLDSFGAAQIIIPLKPATVLAMQYALYAQMNRLFSFSLAPELIVQFSYACEKYLENHLEHHFSVLDMLDS